MKRPALQNKQVALLRMAFRARKVLGTFEKQGPGLVEETIRIKEQPKSENNLEPSTTIADKLETTQLGPPDPVYVNLSDSPYQPENFRPSGVREEC